MRIYPRNEAAALYIALPVNVCRGPQDDAEIGPLEQLPTPAASAVVWRRPYRSESKAITAAAAATPHAGRSWISVSNVRVSTVGPWASATVMISSAGQPDSATAIVHEVQGKWRYASVGTDGEWVCCPERIVRILNFRSHADADPGDPRGSAVVGSLTSRTCRLTASSRPINALDAAGLRPSATALTQRLGVAESEFTARSPASVA